MIKVLVTNDDGINAPGIKALVKALSNIAEVYVVAPDSQRSGMSHAITITTPLIATSVQVEDAVSAYRINGNPADCIKFGVQKFKQEGIEFDFVFSGINQGVNLGRDVHYSGTVNAAIEGAICGIRSVALSVGNLNSSRFGYIAKIVPEVLELSRQFTSDIVLNVNAPDLPASEIKGVKFVEGRVNTFSDELIEIERGTYRYGASFNEVEDQNSDVWLVSQGFVTITPLCIDWADRASLAKLNGTVAVKPACLLIDFQEKLVPAVRKNKDLMTNVTKLARCLERLELPVVVSQQYSRGLGNTVPELRKALGQYEQVDKLDFSCFGAPGFEKLFDSLVSRSVVIAGIEAHICVLQTALDFIERGYNVTILKDCCSSRRKEDFDEAMKLLAARGCTITTWEAFVYMQMGSASHGAFRSISEIVKE